VIVAALAVVGGYLLASSLGLKHGGSTSGGGAGSAPTANHSARASELASPETDGNALITRVLAQLERWPNVAAKFRQVVRLEDDPLHGTGEYWQQGVGNQRRTCWRWQTQVNGQNATFSQVYDKNSHLWTDCRFPERRTVTRVDVTALRRQLNLVVDGAGQGRAGSTGGAGDEDLVVLGRGGLSQLMAELRRCFDFGPPTPIGSVGGPRQVAIVGRWKGESLEQEWPSLSGDDGAHWPTNLPHHVVVKIGENDLFPYAIEYRRGADAAMAAYFGDVSDPLARYEFFDVRWAVTMPAQLFEFNATDVDWHDVTGRVLERIRPTSPEKVAELPPREGTWR
jgi:hypothetical protein